MLERPRDIDLEGRPAHRRPTNVEEPEVEPRLIVRSALELDRAPHPTAGRRVGHLGLNFRLVVPRAVEREGAGEAEGRSVAVEQQQGRPERTRVGIPDPDEAHRIRRLPEPETAERPELQRLTGERDGDERTRRRGTYPRDAGFWGRRRRCGG